MTAEGDELVRRYREEQGYPEHPPQWALDLATKLANGLPLVPGAPFDEARIGEAVLDMARKLAAFRAKSVPHDEGCSCKCFEK